MSIRKTTIISIFILLILNSLLLLTYYRIFLTTKISNSHIELNKKYEIALNEIVPILENSTKDNLKKEAQNLVKKYNAFINIKDSNGKILYSNDEKSESEIYKVTALIKVEDKNYLINYYDNTDISISSFQILRDLLVFQLILWFIFTIFGTIFANFKVLAPIVKLQRDMKNYKYGILPQKRKVKTGLDELQNTFVDVVDDLQKEKSKQSRIIASLSHDIKTPLTSIMGYTDRLKSAKLNDDTKREYINKIYNKSLVMKELVEEFDDYLSCNIKETLKMEKVLINDLLEELKNDYYDELKEKKIKLMIKSNCNNNHVLIDKAKIKRVFSNIITNSINHSNKEKKEIIIYANKKGYEIEFTISDNGIGVKEDELLKIFEPLYTKDPSRRIPGLGLSICKEIVELHDGKINARNNIHGGLSITFTLKRRV